MKQKTLFFLLILSALALPVFFVNADISDDSRLFWDDSNPYHQPTATTYYYGSGDVNLDGLVDSDDYSMIRDMVYGYKTPNIMADVNGDGVVNQTDRWLLRDAAYYGAVLPGWWNQLTTREARESWVLKMINVDWDDKYYADNAGLSPTGQSDSQANLNFTLARWDNKQTSLGGGQTIFNLPFYMANWGAYGAGQIFHAILVGDDPRNFDDWMFVRIEQDGSIKLDDWGPYISLNIYSLKDFYTGHSSGTTSDSVVRFNSTTNGPVLNACYLLTSEPPISTAPVVNPTDRWNPKVIGRGAGFILFDQMREDLSRVSDIHLSPLPYDAEGAIFPVTGNELYSGLIDAFVDESGVIHLLWKGTLLHEYSNIFNREHHLYYGKLDETKGEVYDVEQLSGNYDRNGKGRLLQAPDGTLYAFMHDGNYYINWYSNTGGTWSSNGSAATFVKPESSRIKFNEADPNRFIFDAVVTDTGKIQLAWTNFYYQTRNLYFSEYSPASGTWSAKQTLYTGAGPETIAGLSMTWDGSKTVLAFWDDHAPTTGINYRGKIYVMEQSNGLYWYDPQLLDASKGCASVKAVSDGNGKTVIAWTRRTGTEINPVYAVRQGDGDWEDPLQLETREGADAYYPDAAFTEDNNIYISWSSRSAETIEIESIKITVSAAPSPIPTPYSGQGFAQKVKTPITIDGTAESLWNSAPVHTMTRFAPRGTPSAGDLSGTFKTAWDNKYFYVLAEIKDDLFSTAGTTIFDDDSFHLFFDVAHDGGGMDDPDNFWYYITTSGSVVSERNYKRLDCLYKKVTATGSYTAEFAIPWTTLGIVPTPHLVLGFDCSYTDNDGAAANETTMAWRTGNRYSSTTGEWSWTPSRAGDMTLWPAAPDLPAPPVLHYDFDEGQAIDISGNGNDGSLAGTSPPSSLAGIFNKSMNFDNGHIVVPDNDTLDFGTGDFSFSCWIKTTETTAKIIEKKNIYYHGYSLEVSGGKPLLQINDPEDGFHNYVGGVDVNDNQWHHITISVDRDSTTGVKIYVDGICWVTTDATHRMGDISNDGVLYIGKAFNGDYDSWKFFGQLDDVRIYNRVLGPKEVEASFAQKNTYFSFDGTLADTSGNANNGTSEFSCFSAGVKNAALNLKDSDSAVVIPKSPSLDAGDGDFSIAFWMKTSQYEYGKVILDNLDGTQSSSYSTGGFRIYQYGHTVQLQLGSPSGVWTSYYMGYQLHDDQWHYITLSLDRGSSTDTLKFYIDGDLDESYTQTAGDWSLSSWLDLSIGGSYYDTYYTKFNGLVDELAFYKKALTASEILAQYNELAP